MGSLAENLEPPFYAAILNDNDLGLEDEAFAKLIAPVLQEFTGSVCRGLLVHIQMKL